MCHMSVSMSSRRGRLEIEKAILGASEFIHIYAHGGNEISSCSGRREGGWVANRCCQWLTKSGYEYRKKGFYKAMLCILLPT